MRGYKNLRLRVRAAEDFALRLFFFIALTRGAYARARVGDN